jgi:hypothetical protein
LKRSDSAVAVLMSAAPEPSSQRGMTAEHLYNEREWSW